MPVVASWHVAVLAAALCLELGTAGTVVVLRQSGPATVAGPSVQARASLDLQDPRTRAVRGLLAERSRAVLARDRAAFLAGVDPQASGFAARQAALFDALVDVPLASWSYTVDAAYAEPPDAALSARYGTWWSPRVVLAHALAGIDADPVEAPQQLTFVQRATGWYIAADDDFAARGDRTQRELWDGGPVSVVRGQRCLVLGHPAAGEQLRRLAADVDAAVPRVTAVWGNGWSQQVAVVVPADAAELAALVEAEGGLGQLAALAVARPARAGTVLGGDRVLVSPANLALLSEVGRRVVLTHEVTHVAARPATGPGTPKWLSEGLADHVGYLGAGVPVRLAAQELAIDVRAGRLPAALPADAAFRGDDPALAQAYEQAFLAVEVLVARYGQERVLAAYRAVGSRSSNSAVDDVLREQLGIGLAELTTAWQAFLREQLA